MRHSVEGYDIYDKNGRVLYNGDVVEMYWGGMFGKRIYRQHLLRISKTGRLKLADCENIIEPTELVKIDRPTHPFGEDIYR